MTRPSRLVALVLAAFALFAGVACGEDNKVGSDVDLSIKEQANERLGETTTTKPKQTTTTVAGQGDKAGITDGEATTTTAAQATTTTAAQATTTTAQTAALSITINSDSGATTQFNPSAARVFTGSIVKWTNKDTVARSIEFDDGSAKSGSIAPGGSFSYTAAKSGSFNYHDGTRPYAVGTLEVVKR